LQTDAVVAPSRAVQAGRNGKYVFVVKDDKSVEMRPVTVSRTFGDDSVIAAGLQAGEIVVTDGQLRLTPGTKVKIKEDKQSAASRPASQSRAVTREAGE